jgi:hypothetical protein
MCHRCNGTGKQTTDLTPDIPVTVTGFDREQLREFGSSLGQPVIVNGELDVVDVARHLEVASVALGLEAEAERLQTENAELKRLLNSADVTISDFIRLLQESGSLLDTANAHVKTLIRENAKLHKLIDGGK